MRDQINCEHDRSSTSAFAENKWNTQYIRLVFRWAEDCVVAAESALGSSLPALPNEADGFLCTVDLSNLPNRIPDGHWAAHSHPRGGRHRGDDQVSGPFFESSHWGRLLESGTQIECGPLKFCLDLRIEASDELIRWKVRVNAGYGHSQIGTPSPQAFLVAADGHDIFPVQVAQIAKVNLVDVASGGYLFEVYPFFVGEKHLVQVSDKRVGGCERVAVRESRADADFGIKIGIVRPSSGKELVQHRLVGADPLQNRGVLLARVPNQTRATLNLVRVEAITRHQDDTAVFDQWFELEKGPEVCGKIALPFCQSVEIRFKLRYHN